MAFASGTDALLESTDSPRGKATEEADAIATDRYETKSAPYAQPLVEPQAGVFTRSPTIFPSLALVAT